MQKGNENKRKKLKDILSLPSDALLGEVRVEIRGRELLLVNGCRRILEYSPTKISIAAKGFCITVEGADMICTSYHCGAVTVEGRIGSLSYFEEE